VTAAGVLQEARRRRVDLIPEGDRVRVRGPRRALTPQFLGEIRTWKNELLAILSASHDGATSQRIADFRQAFLAYRATGRHGIPILHVPGCRTSESGGCVSCGESLPQTASWVPRCAICAEAAREVLRNDAQLAMLRARAGLASRPREGGDS
jgi:hypothetical protein